MNLRLLVQLVASLVTNANLKGFFTGKIYDGVLKRGCVPTLNCYSCPGALFSCPVGAAQVTFSSGGTAEPAGPVPTLRERLWNVLSGTPWFVIGFLTAVGAIAGRATCGWLCPFGLLQDLLHRLPTPKWRPPKAMRLLKYLCLVVLVVLMPLFWVDSFGYSEPAYCKYLCPAGTLQGGILLPLLNPDLRGVLGKLFAWKMTVLALFLATMVFVARPFCSWACPLGAFLAPFNRASLLRLHVEADRCVQCGACRKVCVAGLDPVTELDSGDCVRCLECARVCPLHLIRVEAPFLPTPTHAQTGGTQTGDTEPGSAQATPASGNTAPTADSH